MYFFLSFCHNHDQPSRWRRSGDTRKPRAFEIEFKLQWKIHHPCNCWHVHNMMIIPTQYWHCPFFQRLKIPLPFHSTQNLSKWTISGKITESQVCKASSKYKLKDFIGKRSRYFENDGKRSHYFDTARPGGAGFKGATPPQTKLLYISGVKFQG